MAHDKPVESAKQYRERLFKELLENITRQLEMDVELKEIMELLFKEVSKSTKKRQLRDKIDTIKNLFIEAESVQAEGRAIFHRLFGTDYEY